MHQHGGQTGGKFSTAYEVEGWRAWLIRHGITLMTKKYFAS